MSRAGLVYCPFPDQGEADRIARQIIGEGLAACANILGPIRSIYRWQGDVAEAQEVAVLFKCSGVGLAVLVARLAELHSYDVPAILGWPVDQVPQAFADWLVEAPDRPEYAQ